MAQVVRHLYKRAGANGSWAARRLLCELLNLANVLGQIVATDRCWGWWWW